MKDKLRKLNFIGKARSRRIFTTNLKNGVVAVEIKNTIGIGARLAWVLEILAYCDEKDLRPQFRFTYSDSTIDYFEPFFRINKSFVCLDESVPFVKIFTIGELDLGKNYDTVLTVELASRLISKYLLINDDIAREVEAFWSRFFPGGNTKVLGVHYRGTDKPTEAPAVLYEKVEENIQVFLERYPDISGVFVSTDDTHFLNYIQNSGVGELVVCRDDTFRATDNVGIHFSGQNKYDINRDAIVNCLLLSRCYALIKSASILSAWSVLFNPDILLVMLNAPFDRYFPERALLERVVYEPVP